MVDIRAVVAGLSACLLACGGGGDDDVDAPPRFCSGRTETVCEDFDQEGWLDSEWTTFGEESAFSLREAVDAPSPPRVGDFRIPAFETRFATGFLRRHIAGTFSTVRVEYAWRNDGLGFRSAVDSAAWLLMVQPDVASEGPFTLGVATTIDELRVARVATGTGGGNYFERVGGLPAVGAWHQVRLDVTVRPAWSYEAYVDGQRVAGGALTTNALVPADGVTILFGLDLIGPMDACRVSYDNLVVDLVP